MYSDKGLSNFRDVGVSINAATSRRLLREGVLFRSARPEPTSLSGLSQNAGIRTVLDLRTDTERLAEGDGHLTLPENVQRRIVDFNGRPYTTALMKQLTYWQSAQLIFYYSLGYRRDAIAILGKNVLAQRGLTGLAIDSLQHCTAEVKAVFEVLADEQSLPIIVHCTQGKDRTGLVVLLVLLLLNVPLDAIASDYLASQTVLLPERQERLKEIRSIGLPEEFADCDPDWPSRVSACIHEQYGGICAYLQHCGIDTAQQEALKAHLLEIHDI